MLTLRTFGKLALENGDRPIGGSGSQRRPLAILAVLAAAGSKGIPRDRLEALFWPDSDSERAKGSLKQTLYALRRDVGLADLIEGTSHLRLNSQALTSDVAAFAAAVSESRFEDAIALYQGPFMEGIEFSGLDELERFISRERDGMADRFRAAGECLAEKLTKVGKHAEAASLWSRLAHHDPYSSQIALRYMEALRQSGERERALKHAALHERVLKEELGAQVSPEIVARVSELKEGKDQNGSRIHSDHAFSHSVVADNGARPTPEDTSVSHERGTRKPSRIARSAIYSILAVTIVAVFLSLRMGGINSPVSAPATSANTSQLVVLPFENATGDTKLNTLSGMGADFITEGISRSAIVPVIDPGTAAAARAALLNQHGGQAPTILEITRATGATTVVTGEFYRRGDSLEIHARIVDGRTGKVLGAIDPITVSSADSNIGIAQLRTQVMSLIAKVFDARLAQVTTIDAMPPRFEAYREFADGVDVWAEGVSTVESAHQSPDTHNTARIHFRRAFALDTTFIAPLVWALFTYDGDFDQAAHLLDSLLVRRDRLTPLDRHAVDYFDAQRKGDQNAALRAAEQASDLAPRSEWSWNAGQILFPQNRPHETLKYFSRLDPDAGWMRLGWAYYWYLRAQTSHLLGDLSGTKEWLARARKKFPENVPIAAAYARALGLDGQRDSMMIVVHEVIHSSVEWNGFYTYSIIEDLMRHHRTSEATQVFNAFAAWYESRGSAATENERQAMAASLLSLKMDDAAKQHFKKLMEYFPDSYFLAQDIEQLAVISARQGDSVAARKLMESVPKDRQDGDNSYDYWRARVAAELGQREQAVQFLRKSFDGGHPQISLSHSMWFDFPKLEGFPPFEALVASDR